MILVVVDVQIGLDDPEYGDRNNPACESRIADLLRFWRTASLPVIYTRHLSRREGSPLAEGDARSHIKTEVEPLASELVFTKSTNSAFKNPGFAETLSGLGIAEIVFAGIATDACVTACAREAKDLGYRVTVVADACATFGRISPEGNRYPAELVHQVSLASLAASGIRCRPAAELVRRVRA